MKFPSSHQLYMGGLTLLLVTNIFVLSGVAYNRSGEPESIINLTERELSLPYRLHKENSGLSLSLEWRTLARDKDSGSYSGWGSPAWFTEEKLRKLGFRDKDLKKGNSYRRPLPKKAFIVLEFNGESYQEALRRVQADLAQEEAKEGADEQEIKWARQRLKKERFLESRLFAVDAGLDPDQLRKKHPDTSKFLIIPGQVRPSGPHKNKNGKQYHGSISGLSIETIHVPLAHQQPFLDFLQDDRRYDNDNSEPRYQITLAYGKRFEPWITSVTKLPGQKF